MGGGGFDRDQVDVGDGQALGHPVRGVQLGCGEQRGGGPQRRYRYRGAGRQDKPDLGETWVNAGSGAVDIREGRRCGEHDRRVDRRDSCSEGLGGQCSRRGNVDIGDRGGDAEGWSVQRERREGGNQAILRRDPVDVGQDIALGGHLLVEVTHALRRARCARRVQHGCGVIASRRRWEWRARRGQLIERRDGAEHCSRTDCDHPRSGRPAKHSRGRQGRRMADDPLHMGRSDRRSQTAQTETTIRDHRDGTGAPAPVHRREQIATRRHEHGDAVAALEIECGQPRRDAVDAPVQFVERSHLTRDSVDERRGRVTASCFESGPDRSPAVQTRTHRRRHGQIHRRRHRRRYG